MMLRKGTRVIVTATARGFQRNLPAANWLGQDVTGKPVATVTLLEDAPHQRTLDVVDVKTDDGRVESIYDFNIVSAVPREAKK